MFRASHEVMLLPLAIMMSGFAEFIMRTASALLLPALVGYWGIFFAEVLAWLGADVILVSSYYRNIRSLPKCDEEP